MPLNKVTPSSNMYGWLTHTYNTVKGNCPHDHKDGYCYMKKWGEQPILHFDEKELKTDLGNGNFIFVGSSCDLFAAGIPFEWLANTLEHCCKFDNKYLFQSKNPEKLFAWRHNLPENSIIATTIETNRVYKEMCKAPKPAERSFWLAKMQKLGYKTTITIEPIMDFDLDILVEIIDYCLPNFVSIGANTNCKVKLIEPPPGKITALVERLKDFTKVKIKPNLKRIMK